MYYYIKINKLIEKLEKKDIFSLSDFFVEIIDFLCSTKHFGKSIK